MAALIEAIEVKRKTLFEFESTPYYCMDVEVNSPTARGGQTLVRLKMRNLLTNAVFEKTFRAGEKFNEPDLETVRHPSSTAAPTDSTFSTSSPTRPSRSRPEWSATPPSS